MTYHIEFINLQTDVYSCTNELVQKSWGRPILIGKDGSILAWHKALHKVTGLLMSYWEDDNHMYKANGSLQPLVDYDGYEDW